MNELNSRTNHRFGLRSIIAYRVWARAYGEACPRVVIHCIARGKIVIWAVLPLCVRAPRHTYRIHLRSIIAYMGVCIVSNRLDMGECACVRARTANHITFTHTHHRYCII